MVWWIRRQATLVLDNKPQWNWNETRSDKNWWKNESRLPSGCQSSYKFKILFSVQKLTLRLIFIVNLKYRFIFFVTILMFSFNMIFYSSWCRSVHIGWGYELTSRWDFLQKCNIAFHKNWLHEASNLFVDCQKWLVHWKALVQVTQQAACM
jgi:hypothetical protein